MFGRGPPSSHLLLLCLSSPAWVFCPGYQVAHPRTWHVVGGDVTITFFLSTLPWFPSKALQLFTLILLISTRFSESIEITFPCHRDHVPAPPWSQGFISLPCALWLEWLHIFPSKPKHFWKWEGHLSNYVCQKKAWKWAVPHPSGPRGHVMYDVVCGSDVTTCWRSFAFWGLSSWVSNNLIVHLVLSKGEGLLLWPTQANQRLMEAMGVINSLNCSPAFDHFSHACSSFLSLPESQAILAP